MDTDKHLPSKYLGAVIKYHSVLRLPTEAVLQKTKRAWVINQWFFFIILFYFSCSRNKWQGLSSVRRVSEPHGAMWEHGTPTEKADPRQASWESPFSGLLCFPEDETSVRPVTWPLLAFFREQGRKGMQSSTAMPALPVSLPPGLLNYLDVERRSSKLGWWSPCLPLLCCAGLLHVGPPAARPGAWVCQNPLL